MTMFQIYKKEIDFGGKTLTLETGKIARQADGSVLATMGQTAVLCTVVGSRSVKEGQDFFPLSVHFKKKHMLPVRFQAVLENAKASQERKKL